MTDALRPIAIDHLVLVVRDLERSASFYTHTLRMRRVDRPGRVDLHFGENKLVLYSVAEPPTPAPMRPEAGAGEFCLHVAGTVDAVLSGIRAAGVEPVLGPVERVGALGGIVSVYVRDPDGNLIELAIHPGQAI